MILLVHRPVSKGEDMRHSYKTALRVKGIRPVPPYHKLRSSKAGEQCITASEPERKRA